jgi:hypothetical protein
MDVSTVNSGNRADRAEKSKETGKHEAYSAHSHAHGSKKESGITTPEDKLELSEAVQDKKETDEKNTVGNGFADFDMDAFQGEIRSKLMESIYEAKKSLLEAGVQFVNFNEDSGLYNVSEDTEAANVPEYWNAENTANRIVDFAMSFRDLAPELTDEEYIEQVRAAVKEGFRLAAKDIGDLPGPAGKLFNDTFNTAMLRFDELVAQARQKNEVE